MSYALFKKSWKDIIFERRNKAYGAFELREEYDNYIVRALIIAVLFAVLSIGGPMIYKLLKPEPKIEIEEMIEVDLAKLPPPPENPNEPPPPPPPKIEMPKVETIKFLPPEVTKDEEVTDEITKEKPEGAVISSETQEGEKGDETAVVQDEPVAAPIDEPKEEEVFTVVEQQPQFPGGIAEMMTFIKKNINYPREAANMGVEGKVIVAFEVGKDGRLDKIQVLKGVGNGCDEEAVRVIKMMPNWDPGKMNGRSVKVKMTVPIKFQLSK